MADIKNASLSFTCPKNKSDLIKSGEYYFCGGCQKTVYDFTTKSAEDLAKAKVESKGELCGIFKPSQMAPQFLKYAAATVLAAVGVSCQDKTFFLDDQISEEVLEIPVTGGVNLEDTTCQEPADSVEEESDFLLGMVYEKQGEPIGGMNRLFEELYKVLEVPADLQKKGRVFISFVISKEGEITEVKLVRGFDPKADAEALRAFKKLNVRFKPSTQRGRPIKSRMVLPIIFK